MTGGGCGVINGAMILSSIGDVSRFAESSKLLAFASLDPAVLHSVNFSACSNRMSKRGSSTLRYTLMNAAHNVQLNNATFGAYYDSKAAQGKSHYCVLGHTARKLVRVIFTLLSRNVVFNLPLNPLIHLSASSSWPACFACASSAIPSLFSLDFS